LLLGTLHVYTEAGIKSALTKSGAYPYEFGCAIAALIPKRERRAHRDYFNVGDFQGCMVETHVNPS